MELLETGGIHNLGYGKIAGASPLQFSGKLLETGGIHNSGYGKIAGELYETGGIHNSSYLKNSMERVGGIHNF